MIELSYVPRWRRGVRGRISVRVAVPEIQALLHSSCQLLVFIQVVYRPSASF